MRSVLENVFQLLLVNSMKHDFLASILSMKATKKWHDLTFGRDIPICFIAIFITTNKEPLPPILPKDHDLCLI